MTPRERYLQSLLFGKPDKVTFSPGGGRESTVAKWRTQGLPEGVILFPVEGAHADALFKRVEDPIWPSHDVETVSVPTRACSTRSECSRNPSAPCPASACRSP